MFHKHSPPPFVAVWTVINEGNNQVRLHNNFNYLGIVNGQTILIHMVSFSDSVDDFSRMYNFQII